MYAPQKESPRHAPTWNRGKDQQRSSFVPQSPAQVNGNIRDCVMPVAREIAYGVPPGAVADCRTCGYFREVPAKVRMRRFCAWTGDRLAAGAVTLDCRGYHTGKWGQLWEA